MNDIKSMDLNEIVSGPDLILRNPFRLAQMPVDCTERALNNRQKVIDVAKKMGMPVPSGQSPVFAIQDGDAYDDLKEAMHHIRDPFNRLLAEIFWFWPQNFSDSSKDQGLNYLINEGIKENIKFLLDGKLQKENHVSIHNLALLHQFIALQTDNRLIAEKSPLNGNFKKLLGQGIYKDEKRSRKHWKSSFENWSLLIQQDGFWNVIKQRIETINDPRLPLDSIDWIRSNIKNILISFNAEFVLRAAENNLVDHIVRQRSILDGTDFTTDEIDNIFGLLTHKYRQRLTLLCKNVEQTAENDLVHADSVTFDFIKQAAPDLKFLESIYPDGNRAVDVLHDEVAEAVLHCQVKFGNKTENWNICIKLLEAAVDIAKGKKARTRVTDNLKTVRELKEEGNNWCEPGYFELPQECVDLLEEAREVQGLEKFDNAIDLLRNALFGFTDLPDHPAFLKHLRHCIAYCLRRMSVINYNRAVEDFNRNARKMLIDSLVCDGLISDNLVICAGCRKSIYGEYSIRTIEEHRFPFCTKCNGSITRGFNTLNAKLKKEKKKSLDQIVLANTLDPQFKAVTTNLKAIEKEATDAKIEYPNPKQLKQEWNLMEPKELIEDLIASAGSAIHEIFNRLAKIILRQSQYHQERTIKKLTTSMAENKNTITMLFPIIGKDNFILNRVLKFALDGYAETTAFVDGICDLVDYTLKFNLIAELNKLSKDHGYYINKIIDSLENDFGHLMKDAKREDSLFNKQVSIFLNLLAECSKKLEHEYVQQINRRLINESDKTQITKSIQSINNNKGYIDSFFHELALALPLLGSSRIPIIYPAIYKSASKNNTGISSRLTDHIIKSYDSSYNEELVKFMIFLLGDDNRAYESILELLTGNCQRTLRSVLLAAETTNQKQAEKLSIVIKKYLSLNNAPPDNVDAKLMIKSLLAASSTKLSNTLLELNEKINPIFEKVIRKKKMIRDLKFLAVKGSGVQKETAQKILQQERQKGFFYRFNIWQWRPSDTFKIAVNEDTWWAMDP